MAQPPRRKPVVGDWNRDGATEVLLMGDRACWIYTLTSPPESTGGGRVLVVLVVMLALFIFFSQLRIEAVGSRSGRGGTISSSGSGGSQQWRQGSEQWRQGGRLFKATLKRSTD